MRFTNVIRTLHRHAHSLANNGTINASEIAHFSRLSSQWWDEQGEFVFLHKMNPVRVQFIREKLEEVSLREHEGEEAPPPKGLRGLDVLDVGCGGGLLSEVSMFHVHTLQLRLLNVVPEPRASWG